MTSINQSTPPNALPDFRSLGVMLRILLIVTTGSLFAAVLRTASWQAVPDDFMLLVAMVHPALLLALVALYTASPWLARLPYPGGVTLALGVVLAAATATHALHLGVVGTEEQGGFERVWLVSLVSAGVLLGYFDLRERALSPALSEARLQALQARIRPHFLFNSINAVLSLIRSDPKRAEAALEDMAELFRVAMSDSRQLSPLAREVELCRQYLQIEQLRLGDRLQVEWHIENMPRQALVPPLVLQPLVENAIYHGIEPAAVPGVVSVSIYKSRDEVHMVIRNPFQGDGSHHPGNRMALSNIRERLSLHFDAESRLETRVAGGDYQVHITLPYLTEPRR